MGVSWDPTDGSLEKKCAPFDGIVDTGFQISWFDCLIVPPANPPVMPAGTYRLGTIIWDTSGMFVGPYPTLISAVDGIVTGVINGEIADITGQVVLDSPILNVVPEPGTAALLGLGFAGLTVAARRRRG